MLAEYNYRLRVRSLQPQAGANNHEANDAKREATLVRIRRATEGALAIEEESGDVAIRDALCGAPVLNSNRERRDGQSE